jgi:hypothetical protein
MTAWEPPAFEEIRMDAELTAYCDDVAPVSEPVEPSRPIGACESAS